MRAFHKLPLAAGILAFAASCAAAALAQEETASPVTLRDRFREACGADIVIYCSTAQTRNERVACLTMHRDAFSQSCQAFLAEHLPHVAGDE